MNKNKLAVIIILMLCLFLSAIIFMALEFWVNTEQVAIHLGPPMVVLLVISIIKSIEEKGKIKE